MPPPFSLVVSAPWASLVPSYVSAGLRLKVLFCLHLRLATLEVTVPTEVPVNLHVSLLPSLVLPALIQVKICPAKNA